MKKRKFFKPVFAMFLAVVMVFCMVPTSASAASTGEIQEQIDALEKENEAIQAEINALQKGYENISGDIQDIVDKKNAIDQEISLLNTQVVNINDQVAAYGQLVADAQEELEQQESYLEELSQKYKERIRAMEEENAVSYWSVIFEASSFTDMLDRINMINEITASDQRRLEEMRKVADEVIATREVLEEDLAELEQTRTNLAETQAALEIKRTESDDLLRELIEKQEEYEIMLAESEAAQEDLMAQIAAKEKELSAAKYKEELVKLALQGQNPPSNSAWTVPVSGYTLTSPFGMRVHPVLGYARMHNGIDMACPQGTPIYATRSGTVTTASYQAGGAGYYVSINHGDGFASIYMHMTHFVVSAGQSVSQGQVIGYVGSTGISTGPHLHFGISYGGTYVNPLAYI